MRDPERIKRALEIIQEVWKRLPDLRLGQLLVSSCGTNDLFGFEDVDILLNLGRTFADSKKFRKIELSDRDYNKGTSYYVGEYEENKDMFYSSGYGKEYYENGTLAAEGYFCRKGLELGRLYYPNGNIKFSGWMSSKDSTHYGPQYFTNGTAYKEDGTIWHIGYFNCKRSSIGYPTVLSFPECFDRSED